MGSIQVGMLRALFERGIRPDFVVGCSVGALNAAAVAAAPTLEGAMRLEHLWRGLRSEDVFGGNRFHGPWHLAMRGEALYGNDRLRRLVESWLPYRRFEEAAVPLHVVATSLHHGRERWFTSGDVVEPLLASAALPAVFPPVRIDGELYVDGGVVDNVPISRALEQGARRVYVLQCGVYDRQRPDPRRPVDVFMHAFAIARAYRFRAEVGSVPSGVEMVVLPPVDPGPLRYNDLSRSGDILRRAYETACAFLDGDAARAL